MKQATNKVSEDMCANSVQVRKQQRDYIAAIPCCNCDLGRIQTCNLLSRNQVRYSVAPRGHYWAANIKYYYALAMLEIEKLSL